MLVFLSTCKQVKYVFEAFRRLRPGVPLRCIHGKMKQMRRMATFYEFSEVRAHCLPHHCSTAAACKPHARSCSCVPALR